jgi:thiosulfate reductase cytochrome b subunit
MPSKKPYQPLVLRILHSINGVLVLTALTSGFLIYNTFDARFGSLPLPRIDTIVEFHDSLEWGLLIAVPAFALYSLAIGNKRLVQRDSLKKLTEVGKPIWWYTVYRIVNTVLLIASITSIVTGTRTRAEWLFAGEFSHPIYVVHLLSGTTIAVGFVLHILMGLKVGGVPLLASIVDWHIRSTDPLRQWLKQQRDRS